MNNAFEEVHREFQFIFLDFIISEYGTLDNVKKLSNRGRFGDQLHGCIGVLWSPYAGFVVGEFLYPRKKLPIAFEVFQLVSQLYGPVKVWL